MKAAPVERSLRKRPRVLLLLHGLPKASPPHRFAEDYRQLVHNLIRATIVEMPIRSFGHVPDPNPPKGVPPPPIYFFRFSQGILQKISGTCERVLAILLAESGNLPWAEEPVSLAHRRKTATRVVLFNRRVALRKRGSLFRK